MSHQWRVTCSMNGVQHQTKHHSFVDDVPMWLTTTSTPIKVITSCTDISVLDADVGFFACARYFNLTVTYLTPRVNYKNFFLNFNIVTAILGFQKNLTSEQWVSLGYRFSISVPNLVQKCRSTPKLWPKIKIQDGGRPPSWIFENPIFEHCGPLSWRFSISVLNLVQKNVDLRRN